jgi:hypothetical protein
VKADQVRPNDELVEELQDALEAATNARTAQVYNLEELRKARTRFLRRLAELLAPAFPVLIDDGRDTMELGKTGLLLARNKLWYRRPQDEPLSDAQLGQYQLEPVEIVRGLIVALNMHAEGRDRAAEILGRESKRFEALLALLDC